MNPKKLLSYFSIICLSLILIISCGSNPERAHVINNDNFSNRPIVIGYSNWAGWWPWAIAEQEGLFTKNNIHVQLKWFDGYRESIEAFAAGQLDGNCQTLNDTISFAPKAVDWEVAVLVNDNSAGNDKIIVTREINTISDLKHKKVAVEEGVVNDFLLTLALEAKKMKRSDVEIVPLETGAAAVAFASGQTDAVGAFPPYWLTALQREGSKELISSAEFPGSIPDLLVVSQKLIDQNPDLVQGLVNTWFDVLSFIEQNPKKADQIMAARANVSIEELQLFKKGTKMFSLKDNLVAFTDGTDMMHMPFAARRMAKFMNEVGFIPQVPDLPKIMDDQFIKAYAETHQ